MVYLPLWKIWKSVGMMIFPIYGKPYIFPLWIFLKQIRDFWSTASWFNRQPRLVHLLGLLWKDLNGKTSAHLFFDVCPKMEHRFESHNDIKWRHILTCHFHCVKIRKQVEQWDFRVPCVWTKLCLNGSLTIQGPSKYDWHSAAESGC